MTLNTANDPRRRAWTVFPVPEKRKVGGSTPPLTTRSETMWILKNINSGSQSGPIIAAWVLDSGPGDISLSVFRAPERAPRARTLSSTGTASGAGVDRSA